MVTLKELGYHIVHDALVHSSRLTQWSKRPVRKKALSHNLWCALLCQESGCKSQHFTYLLLVDSVRKQTFAVK